MARVLIVDDDAPFLSLLVDAFRDSGFEVVAAHDGQAASRLFKENEVDLVVTDMIMPEKEGVELIRELRKLRPNIPLIAISGGGSQGPVSYLEMAKAFGANEVFGKPFPLAQLIQKAKDLLAVASSSQA